MLLNLAIDQKKTFHSRTKLICKKPLKIPVLTEITEIRSALQSWL